MTTEEISKDIKDIFSKYFGVDKIGTETAFQDYKLFSEDIDAFFREFSSHFDVNMEAYNYYDYFYEDVHLVYIVRDWFLRVFNRKKSQRKRITIGHLIEVAEKGHWFKP